MTFRVGVTSDLKTASGEPCFNPAAFDELAANPEIEWEWIDAGDEVTVKHAAEFDALHVNLPRVTAASVASDDLRLKIVARNGVGYDTVDIEALSAKGVLTTNTPLAIRRPVAVAALTHAFALTSKLLTKDRLVRAGKWNERVEHMGVGLTSRTLGVIGAGGIGREMMGLAAPFFGDIVYSDPLEISIEGTRQLMLETLLSEADIIVVACLLTDDTRHLINEAAFGLMKPTAFFINVSRGPIHDETALIAALQSKQIAGAGLDVTEHEPIAEDSPLLTMDNTIITAHSLCWTDECFEDIARTALRSIVDVSLGNRPDHVVTA
jgi:D-3-phosphoglycerate dehydrogenase